MPGPLLWRARELGQRRRGQEVRVGGAGEARRRHRGLGAGRSSQLEAPSRGWWKRPKRWLWEKSGKARSKAVF